MKDPDLYELFGNQLDEIKLSQSYSEFLRSLITSTLTEHDFENMNPEKSSNIPKIEKDITDEARIIE